MATNTNNDSLPKTIIHMDISDQRNYDQLHHYHRQSVQIKQTRKNNSHYSSQSQTNADRTQARTQKRQQLTDFYRPIILDSARQTEEDSHHNTSCHSNGKLIVHEIADAIKEKDADYLHTLLTNLYTPHSHKQKYQYDRPWTYVRHMHTILTYVLKYGNSDCVQLVLDKIFDGTIYPTIVDHVCSTGRTPLWYACEQGNIDVVRQLIERGHAHISKCGVLIVAAQNGHKEVVEYLLSAGCDPNRPTKNYNETALHAATRRNRTHIVKLLLEYGADINVRDKHRRTALEYAIHKRHIEIVQLLIQYSNGHFYKNKFGFTPLMVAAYYHKQDIVDIFLNILPRQQALEDLALLGCKYIIEGHENRRHEAYCYLEKYLGHTTPISNQTDTIAEAYKGFSECRTLGEFGMIRDNDEAVRMYALLLSQRLSCANCDINNHLTLITKESCHYKNKGLFHRCLQLQLDGYKLSRQIKHKHSESQGWHTRYLRDIIDTLLHILEKEDTIPFHPLRIALTWILDQRNISLADELLQLVASITYMVEGKKISDDELKTFCGIIWKYSANDYCQAISKILWICVDTAIQGQNSYTVKSKSVPIVSIIRLLVNARIYTDGCHHSWSNFTVLHTIAECSEVDIAKPIIELLVHGGAHLDYVDAENRRPEDLAQCGEIRTLLSTKVLSLKCRCAELIKTAQMCDQIHVPLHLLQFVKRHRNLNFKTREASLWNWNAGSSSYW